MEAKVISTDLKEISCFLIAGKKGSGRKNATKVLIHAAKKAGASVYVFGTKEQSLKAFAEQQSTIYIEQKKDWCDCLRKIEEEQRKQHETAKEPDKQNNTGKDFIEKQCYMYGTGMQDLAIDDTNEIQKNSYRILVIEDMYDFVKQLYEEQDEETDCIQLLEKIIEQTFQNKIIWIGICNIEEIRRCMAYPVFSKMTRKKNGLYLGGKLSEQSLFNYENVTFEEGQQDNGAGTGYAFLDTVKNIAVPIVIPLVIKE